MEKLCNLVEEKTEGNLIHRSEISGALSRRLEGEGQSEELLRYAGLGHNLLQPSVF